MSEPAQKVKTRILIISDTHNRPLQDAHNSKSPFREPLPPADVLIHCGDLTMEGSLADYHATLDAIKHHQAPLKLVIAGNHDLTLDEEWMRTHEGDYRIFGLPSGQLGFEACREFWTGEQGRAKKEGVVFLDEGVHEFVLGNGGRLRVYASPYTPEFWDWGFPYTHSQDRFNHPSHSLTDAQNIAETPIASFEDKQQIDVMITHGPPYKCLDHCASGHFAGCHHLLRALMRARPLIHCFGHIHEGWGAEIVDWAENAAAIAIEPTGQEEWRQNGWKRGIEGEIASVVTSDDLSKAADEHAVLVDVSEGSGRRFERGRQSLLVNAAIVDIRYDPINAPILVDVDLVREGK